ncbi:hypothetical protein T310_5962 [Rasamsonia emersonii CBS 393.64]|uniref:Uncharacterized protein n=1 Tax=Rasamsonia emersonii (strain ATCC 16479 / CBS 393.64 / IMI 116815) TaxID=1408163 RepID=A0A0F4YP44_RASE3|nr:hypothetical protein T310_5962 [Rasamsonia emersonii CBS 393.64]KKA20019.1 hypothetical protein T310_5962 [Rasamsonia emersonii CBS 393.64]
MAESSETTPLLTDPSTGPSGGQNEQTNTLLPNSTVEPPAPYTRATFILTWLSIALSVLTFGFTAAIAIMDQYSPHDYYMDWQIRESCQIMIGLSAFVAFISSLNLLRLYRRRRATWLLNLIVDAIVAFYSVGYCVNGLSMIISRASYGSDCSSGPWDPTTPPDYETPTCEAFAKKIRILAGIGLGFGLAMAKDLIRLGGFQLDNSLLSLRSNF